MRTAAVSLALAAQLVVGSSGAIQVLAADASVPTGTYGEGPGATGLLDLPGASTCGQPELVTAQGASSPENCHSEER
jgi:hypothetical protein